MPGHSQIWTKHQRPLDEGGTVLKVMNGKGKRIPASTQSDRIIVVQLSCPPRQPRGFGGLFGAIDYEAVPLSPSVAPGRDAVSGGKIRIEFDGLVEQP